jgi:hypothetical protein
LRNKFLDQYQRAWEKQKSFLYSFIGQPSNAVRLRIFESLATAPDAMVADLRDYKHWTGPYDGTQLSAQKKYCQIMAESRFALCPGGAGASSIRFFEAMEMGVAPVVISDTVVLPEGPQYEKFLVRIPSSQVKDVPGILKEKERDCIAMGQQVRIAWEEFFSPRRIFNTILEQNSFQYPAGYLAPRSRRLIFQRKKTIVLYRIKNKIPKGLKDPLKRFFRHF